MHRLGRILFAGFDAAKDAALAGAGECASGSTRQVSAEGAVAEVERAQSQGSPYQVAVLHATAGTRLQVSEAVRELRSADPAPAIVLVASPSQAARFRSMAGRFGDGIFVLQKPLGDNEHELIRALAGQRASDRKTRLREQEEALAQQSSLLDATLNSMRQGLMVLTPDLKVSLFNRQAAELVGYGPEVLRIGAAGGDLVAGAVALGHYPGRRFDDVYAAWRGRLERNEAFERRQSLADGRELAINYAPMAGGGWVIILDDITDRIRAEEAHEEQNQRLDVALRNMSHGLCMFDGSKRVILCNAAYGRMYSLPAELMAPGTPLQRILDFRVSIGNDPLDLAAYININTLAHEKDATVSRFQLIPSWEVHTAASRSPPGEVSVPAATSPGEAATMTRID